MKSDSIRQMKNHRLDAPGHLVPDENVDIWFARDLMALFGYARWENFQAVIKPIGARNMEIGRAHV